MSRPTTILPQIKDFEMFTQVETAKLLGVCTKTVSNYESEGLISGHRVRKYKMYSGRAIKRCCRDIQKL